jgi:hypothetical protein
MHVHFMKRHYTRSVIHLGSDIHCMLYKVAIFAEIALEQGQSVGMR